ncbi:MAG: carboxypeptidase regulatory-like domain-containing protein [Myxococcales bacterium]|nr:carboxypeptidase regulatory-like domain-containing protein [Myxococcales bacterium]
MPRARTGLRTVLMALALLAIALFAGYRLGVRRGTSGAPSAASAAPASASTSVRLRPRRGGFGSIQLSEGAVERANDGRLGVFAGRVVSAGDGAPVPQAELTFVGPDGARVVRSGADGSFVFQPERAGLHEVVGVSAPGFLPLSAELSSSPITLTARLGVGIVGVLLRLQPLVRYRGLVVDEGGRPAAGAHVRVVGGDEFELDRGDFAAEHQTNDAGEVSFNAPDGAIVEATHASLGAGRSRIDVSARISKRVRIKLVRASAERGGTIRGRVIDETGAERADVAVVARRDAENPAAELISLPVRGRTDAAGVFLLTGLELGRYFLMASDGTSAPASLRDVPVDGPQVTLTLSLGVSFGGRVTHAATGAPVAAFSVMLSERRGPIALEAVRAVTVFDADGQFVIEGLRPGRYLMLVAAAGFAASVEREIDVAEGKREDVSLSVGAKLVGVVRDAVSHAPLQHAKVSLEGRHGGGEGAVQLIAAAESDAAGRFVLSGLGPGERSVLVEASAHHARLIGGLSVRGEESLGPLEVELTPLGADEEPRIELVGIGAVLAAKDDALMIGQVMPGSGAAEAGLVPGDALLAIDGQSVVALGFEGAIHRIRGPEGSQVLLLVRRADGGAPVSISVTRRRVKG